MRRRRASDILATTIGIICVVGIVITLVVIGANIPCSWYQFHKASEVPARCLTNFKH